MASTVQTKVPTSAIQSPTADGKNHATILRQLKEAAEIAQRLRGDPENSYVRVGELVNNGIIRMTNGTIQPPNTTTLPVGYVPSARNINTIDSITGGGNLGADLTLSLVGDAASPGNTMLYGTNGSGTKGWYAQPSSGGGTTLSAAILADSPFAFWKGDDASTSLADSSGNGFNLTGITGTPTYQSGLLIPTLPSTTFVNYSGYSSALAATGHYLASALGRTLPLTQWTFECVVGMFGASNIVRIIDWRVSSTSVILAIYNNGGPLGFTFNNSGFTLLSQSSFGNGKPYHLIITCSTTAGTSTLTAYVNGVKFGAATAAASTASGGSPSVGLGDNNAVGTTAGFTIGYVALYSTILSTARIGAHAQASGLFGT